MAGFKHQLKGRLRTVLAHVFAWSPVWHLTNRLAPQRLLILFGHCVDDDLYGGVLAPDMCLSRARFEQVIDSLRARGAELGSIGAGLDRLQGGAGARAQVALSMDDGYHDNARVMTPLLQARGLSATFFLETRALSERRVNWTHHLHWLFDKLGAEVASRALAQVALEWTPADAEAFGPVPTNAGQHMAAVIDEALGLGARAYYHVKRRLKYDVHPGLRDALLNQVFLAHGGDNPALADHLYMRWDEAQVMQAGGMELGGHTVTHAILSTLDAREQAAEIGGSVQAIAARLGQAPRVFAYPFGRKWDYNADSLRAVQAAGCELAVNTHSGTNTRASKPLELRRVPVEEGTSMALLLAEACGGFLLLERLGLSLSE